MKRDKVKEVQDYLKKQGIKASEVAIVDAAIDIVLSSGTGIYSFVFVLKDKKK